MESTKNTLVSMGSTPVSTMPSRTSVHIQEVQNGWVISVNKNWRDAQHIAKTVEEIISIVQNVLVSPNVSGN